MTIRKFHLIPVTFILASMLSMMLLAPSPVGADAAAIGEPLGTYSTGIFDQSAAEIVSYDPKTERVYVVNSSSATVDVLDISDPSDPTKVSTLDASSFGAGINSVDVRGGVIAAAVEADPKTDPGSVVFYDRAGSVLSSVTVGALPDMVTFTPDGKHVLVANEGEPESYCEGTADPEGSVSVINVSKGFGRLGQSDVKTAHFRDFNDDRASLVARGVRIFGPGASVAQDLEPEYVAVSKSSKKAWVSLQENNAIAIVHVPSGTVRAIRPLGLKDHSQTRNALDPSDEDGGVSIATWPVNGMYMPDAIASFNRDGQSYLLTANEGDGRDYECYSDETRVEDVTLDPAIFPNGRELQDPSALGRLKMSLTSPTNADGEIIEIHSYGARSFSILNAWGHVIWDSGSEFEDLTAALLPGHFNSNNDENGSFDSRSDDKGPEPEGIDTGRIGKKLYAFIGLERIGGVMVYDITNLSDVHYVTYFTNRDFDGDAEAGTAGDLGPEGLYFIPAAKSPNDRPLLVVGNEVSGSTTIHDLSGL